MVFVICWFGLLFFVVVGCFAVLVGRPQVHPPGVLAGAAAICGDAPAPSLAVAGRGTVCIFHGLILDVPVRVGHEGSNPGYLLHLSDLEKQLFVMQGRTSEW